LAALRVGEDRAHQRCNRGVLIPAEVAHESGMMLLANPI
jgi:hypothetical protein